MTTNELRKYVSNWGAIELRAPKDGMSIKKNWIKRYDLNALYDEFDYFDVVIFTDHHKIRSTICVPGIAQAANNHELAMKILLECIEKDQKEGFILIK